MATKSLGTAGIKETIEVLESAQAVLVAVQWSNVVEGEVSSWSCCPSCGQADFRHHHKEGCDIDKVIKNVSAQITKLRAFL